MTCPHDTSLSLQLSSCRMQRTVHHTLTQTDDEQLVLRIPSVNVQSGACGEPSFTPCTRANVGPMTHHVDSQIAGHLETEATHGADIWGFSCVCPHVAGQICLLGETLATISAFMWLLSCVSPHVFFEIPPLLKHLPTLRTLIWLLSGMCPHVPT